MLCQLSRKQLNQNKDKVGLPWTYDDLVRIGTEVCTARGGKPLLGVKQEPWWPFLKFEHLMVPLLHCLIGIGNNLINRFCDVVNEYVENLSAAEMKHARALSNYGLIMVKTAKKRDELDASPDGIKAKGVESVVFVDTQTRYDHSKCSGEHTNTRGVR